ncbi:dihydrofolate reductase [Lactobacillus colini]|uniref:Dihydrofolate reductase n=1 Tax=Lactobacillus colini TaxID=1819254 RepID=A0ABS4MG50_9LACO|nr:dihydrofolate reductase [Lactobacillus colini]MBP2058671.1 dihydrofolate reductase [Lactobacillus colini]
MISFVWAEDEAGNIGYQGKLPWHLPADLHHFKEKTIGHSMVMGRKTFDSFPGILPNRQHVVLTHSLKFKEKYQNDSRVKVFTNIIDLKKWLNKQVNDVAVIGGASLFKELEDEVNILEKTEIHHHFKADVKMIPINYKKFELIDKQAHHADEKNKYDYTFLTYKKKLN